MPKHDKHFFIALAASLVLSALIAVGAQGASEHVALATSATSVA